MRKKIWFVVCIVLILGILAAGYAVKSYRGMGTWPLKTQEATACKQALLDSIDGLEKVSINYRWPQVLEITCRNKDWTAEQVDAALELVASHVFSDEFQSSYAEKYKARFDDWQDFRFDSNSPADGAPDSVVVHFYNSDDLFCRYSIRTNVPQWTKMAP